MSESSNSDAQLGRVRLESRDAMDTVVGALSPNGPRDQQFPLVRCLGPVRAGQEGRAAIRVANDEETPSRLTLYCTNLAGDSGYDIASLRIVCSPRIATIRAKSEALFSVVIAVPEQTPPGNYCGLIQATGALYVKAVLSVQVI
jgi:hypothetical protein